MSDELKESLAKLVEPIYDLNKRMDRVADEIREVEETLAALHVGVSAEIKLPESGDKLVYTRIGEKYRIGYTVAGGDPKPLLDCKRGEKLAGLQHLAELIDSLRTEVENRITVVDAVLTQKETEL